MKLSQDKSPHTIEVENYSTDQTPALETKYWIESLGLTLDHKIILQGTRWLDDRLIDACEKVLAEQFRNKFGNAGFQSVIHILSLNYAIESGIFIQILHNGNQHWLVVTTIGTHHPEVFVYDSLYRTVSQDTKNQISSLLCTNEKAIHLKFVNVVKQSGGNYCGVFVVAYVTALCFGRSPGNFSFHQAQIRNQLLNCLENQHFIMFPIIRERREISMYCNCLMPAIKPMVKCSICHECFHIGACVNVESKTIQYTNIRWTCSGCKNKA